MNKLDNLPDSLNTAPLETIAKENIIKYLSPPNLPEWVSSSLTELIDKKNWNELNYRFNNQLSFGTGGMRGRTISQNLTEAEKGNSTNKETPENACVGTATLNEINILSATKSLFEFTKADMSKNGKISQPVLVIAYDVRHFSEKFAHLVSHAWNFLGGQAMIFEGPRPTPLLSYTVRKRKADAGVVITASHNPFHDNGFKAYYNDGSQLSGRATEEISKKFEESNLEEIFELLEPSKNELTYLTQADDSCYIANLQEAVFNPEPISSHCPKILFTPIHGTGAIATLPALWEIGADVKIFEKQKDFDPNFSSVQSPNPESEEAFKLSIECADKNGYQVVFATDPDSDRVGVAVKYNNSFNCLTGNQVGSMLMQYRAETLQKLQLLNSDNASNFTTLKTFVTTGLIEKIAASFGVGCVNTHTGFKWMAKKLGKYEKKALREIREREGISLDFDNTDRYTRLEILTRYSKYCFLASEESYGYLTIDTVRDKDASAATLSIVEMFSFLRSQKIHPLDFLDKLYFDHGFHYEKTENIYHDGEDGSVKIGNIMKSYRNSPPKQLCDLAVTNIKDFSKEGHEDEENEELAQENFLLISLENGFRVALRPSGTEPKIKFYIFGESEPKPSNLEETKQKVIDAVNNLGTFLVEDAEKRSVY